MTTEELTKAENVLNTFKEWLKTAKGTTCFVTDNVMERYIKILKENAITNIPQYDNSDKSELGQVP